MLKNIIQFLKTDIWKIRVKTLPPQRAFFINSLRVILLAIQDFQKDRIQLRASALTFYTMLTIVPVLAMAFGVAQGFGLEKSLEGQLYLNFKGQKEALDMIFNFVNAMLERTRGGIMAGIGVLILLWSVIRILGNIEDTLNMIWHVKIPRTTVRKLTDYIALMIIGPILMVLSSSITVFITTTIEQYTASYSYLKIVNVPLQLAPYAIIWLLLTFLYYVLPNTSVKIIPALIGGIVAGTAYQLLQWGYINFQIVVSNINAIYGSFAALPLFIIWVQLSWIIVLVGAEISFGVQNVLKYEQKDDMIGISLYQRKIMLIYIVHLLVKRFKAEAPPLTALEIAQQLDIPLPVVKEMLKTLENSRIVNVTKAKTDKLMAYQPARDIDKLSIYHILNLLEQAGKTLKIDKTHSLSVITNAIDALKLEEKSSTHNLKLKDF